MERLRKIARGLVDFIEVTLPSLVFGLLFLVFLDNVLFRYVLRDPQNWTFELSTTTFVVMGLLGICTAYRQEDHVVFDLIYNKFSPKNQNILRMISALFVIGIMGAAIPPSLLYLAKLPSMSSILRIPDRLIFLTFPIFMISTVSRSAYRLVLDIRAFRAKTYVQSYNTAPKDELI
jgi:TRAP-type C4-dicarboxylate transport system permease small subunit